MPSNLRLQSPPGRTGSLARGSYNSRKRPLRRSRCEHGGGGILDASIAVGVKRHKQGDGCSIQTEEPSRKTHVPEMHYRTLVRLENTLQPLEFLCYVKFTFHQEKNRVIFDTGPEGPELEG